MKVCDLKNDGFQIKFGYSEKATKYPNFTKQ